MPTTMNQDDVLHAILRASKAKREQALAAAAEVIQGPGPDRLLVNQVTAARMLGVSRVTLWKMTKGGKIETVGVHNCRRYRVADLKRIAS